MASTAMVTGMEDAEERQVRWRGERASGARASEEVAGEACLLVVLGRDDLPAAIEARRADVVAKMDLAAHRFDRERGLLQVVVRAMHATLGRRLLVLLDCH